MKTKIGLILLIVFAAVLLANCSQPVASIQTLGAATLSTQIITPTPPAEDQSRIGSTDGILIMGIVIVAITSFPIFFKKKKQLQRN
jgi:hypothetical protein